MQQRFKHGLRGRGRDLASALLVAALLCCACVGADMQASRRPAAYGSVAALETANFLFLSLCSGSPEVQALLAADGTLSDLARQRRSALHDQFGRPPSDGHEVAKAFSWSNAELETVGSRLVSILSAHPEALKALATRMRESGHFARYHAFGDAELILCAWRDAGKGLNLVLQRYVAADPTVAEIDRFVAETDPASSAAVLGEMLAQLDIELPPEVLFFRPSLSLALFAMEAQNRDEAARYEPLSQLNRSAADAAKSTDFSRYPFAAAIVLGFGADQPAALTARSKVNCHAAADGYRKGLYPFVIASGGHVMPRGTPYAEGVEMRNYLVEALGVPSAAVLVEPYARHTPNNIRNAARVAAACGLPFDRKYLVVSRAIHIDTVVSKAFEKRCRAMFGYVPFEDMERYSPLACSVRLSPLCSHREAGDPLDP